MIDFTEEQRAIFQYHDGKRERCADPDALNRRLLMACPGFNKQLLLVKKGEQEHADAEDQRLGLEAEEQVIAAARTAFDMPCDLEAATPEAFGATEKEVRLVLRTFMDFLKKKETTAGRSPTTSAPTTSGPSKSGPTTKPSSA